MDRESALAALRGLIDHIGDGQSATVHCKGGLFTLDVQRNDEPAI